MEPLAEKEADEAVGGGGASRRYGARGGEGSGEVGQAVDLSAEMGKRRREGRPARRVVAMECGGEAVGRGRRMRDGKGARRWSGEGAYRGAQQEVVGRGALCEAVQ